MTGFVLPTLQGLVERARRAMRAELPGTDAWLWPNNVGPSAKVIGEGVYELFGSLDTVNRAMFAMTADGDALDRHGQAIGLGRHPAAYATGSVILTAAPGGATVDVGARLRRSDGIEYRVLFATGRDNAGPVSLSVEALTAGRIGNAAPGTALEVGTGISGADADTDGVAAVVNDTGSGLIGGLDAEGDGSYRARILHRKRNPPRGGAPADYVAWACEVPGVDPERVFVEPLWAGNGTVRVFPLMPAYPDGIPPPEQIQRIRNVILRHAPAGALVAVVAPTPLPINVQIGNLSPNNAPVREAAKAELREMFRRRSRVAGRAEPHQAMPFLATPVTFSRSWVGQAIAEAVGEDSHVLNHPTGNSQLEPGEMATLGPVSFTP